MLEVFAAFLSNQYELVQGPFEKMAFFRTDPLPAVAAPFHQREQPWATPTFGNVIVDALLLCWHLVAIARGCRPCVINVLSKNGRDASQCAGLYSLAQPTLSFFHIVHTLHINMVSVLSKGSADRGAEERLLYEYIMLILFLSSYFPHLPPHLSLLIATLFTVWWTILLRARRRCWWRGVWLWRWRHMLVCNSE